MATLRTVVVVGASLAGLRAVEALRRRGYEGRLIWIGAEPEPPYDRPPLSKEVLRAGWEAERIRLRKDGLHGLEADLRLGRRAVGMDAAAREVELDGGERLRFDGLLIATGASPRPLPGTPPLEGIHLLRTLEQALAIRRELRRGPRVAVVGGGFIGSEVAASCRALGLEVTLIEALATPLEASLGREVGALCAALHRDHGVALRLGVPVAGFEGGPRIARVRLADGSAVEADLVVVGIGVRPETGWLEGSGLPLDDGVLCDETCATPAPGVVAAGDVARWRNPRYGERMRVEHWTNAVEQGAAAAERLLAGAAGAEPFAPVPFVWSDQYDAKLQLAGAPRASDELHLVEGSFAERRFVALYGRSGRLTGAVAMNRSRSLMQWRQTLRENVSLGDALARAAAS